MSATTTQPILFSVNGIIYDEFNTPLPNTPVKLFDIDFRSEQLLGQAKTNEKGFYQVDFNPVAAANPEYQSPDIQLRVYGQRSKLLGQSPVYFNVQQVTTIDYKLGDTTNNGINEFDALREKLEPIIKLSGIALGSLEENGKHQDISFLAGETNEDIQKIEFINQSFVLAAETKIAADIFYGMFRLGLPTAPGQLLAIQAATIKKAVLQAITDNIISSRWEKSLDDITKQFNSLSVENTIAGKDEQTAAIKKLLDTVYSADQQKAFIATWYDNEETPEKFWDKLKGQAGFNETAVKSAKQLLGFYPLTGNQPELAAFLFTKQTEDAELKEMSGYTKYTKSDWAKQINEAGVTRFPAWVTGATPDEKANSYAAALEQLHKDLYPTTFFAARLKQDSGSSIPGKQQLDKFFSKNPAFEIGTRNIHQQLASASFTGVNKDVVTKELKTLNRLYKLTDDYPAVNVLYGKGLFSSSGIISKYGKEQFVEQFATSLGSTETASILYRKAASIDNKSTALLTAFKMRHDINIYVIDENKKEERSNEEFWSGYYEMFEDGELCECEHCQSVYSPAAYFVDILAFMRREKETAYNELMRRRPDLDDILLDCKNTNTPVPYIDLVNELLEKEVIALSLPEGENPGDIRNRSFQTEGLATELAAMPEHINNEAYERLAEVTGDTVFSDKLPVDLPVEEMRIYSKKLGINRYELASSFYGNQSPGKTADEKLAAELFGISTVELKIITRETPVAVTLPLTAGRCMISDLLWKTKLSYVELLQLLETYFLNPLEDNRRTIAIVQEEEIPLLTCNPDKLFLAGATNAWFNKLVRFVRLWKKTGWDIFDLDRILTALRPIGVSPAEWDFSNELIIALADVQNTSVSLKIPVKQLSALFSTIDDAVYFDRTKEGPPLISSLRNDIFKNIVVNDAASLCAALGITAEDLILLGNASDFSAANVSRMYRTVLLAKAFGISLAEFIKLLQLTGSNILIWQPAQLTQFIEDWNIFKALGVKISEFESYFGPAADSEYTIPVSYGLLKQAIDCLDELVLINNDHAITEDERQTTCNAKVSVFLDRINATTSLISALSATLSGAADIALKTVMDKYTGSENKQAIVKLRASEMILKIEALQSSLQEYAEIVLKKAPAIFNKLKFGTEEILWLKDNKNTLSLTLLWSPIADFAGENFFLAFKNLYWLSELAKGGSKLWIAVPDSAIRNAEAAKAAMFERLHFLYGAELSSLAFVCGSADDLADKGKLNLTFPVDYTKGQNIITVLRCCRVMEELGANRIQFDALLSTTATADLATTTKNLLRSKYDSREWLDIIKPVSNQLRIKRRDALTAWLINNPAAEYKSANAIYEFLLIDAQMDACMITSRIKQGISSIQLFIDRCLMNLEQDEVGNKIKLGSNFTEQWNQWRKQYRVWEANRKIFLYPENWIEADLRDGKSIFFKELESQLQQKEVTEESAKEALITYLQKLDTVSNLEIAGLFNDQETNQLHVFGRTPSIPHQYFYRRQADRVWTAWEKVELDIEGDHFLPVIWNGRMMLFWILFTEQQEENTNASITGEISNMTMSSPPPSKYYDMKLAWSEYKNGKWSSKKVSTRSTTTLKKVSTGLHGDNRAVNSVEKDCIRITSSISNNQLYIHFLGCAKKGYLSLHNMWLDKFRFGHCGANPELLENTPARPFPKQQYYHPGSTVDQAMFFVERKDTIDLKLWVSERGLLEKFGSDSSSIALFNKTPGTFKLTANHHNPEQNYFFPFFYSNGNNNFYIYSKEFVKPVRPDDLFSDPLLTVARRVIDIHPITNTRPAVAVNSGSNLPGMAVAPVIAGPDSVFETGGFMTFPEYREKKYGLQVFYHSYVCSYIKKLAVSGIDALYIKEVQDEAPKDILTTAGYDAQTQFILTPYPKEEVDFSVAGSYSIYNWELFYHIPLLIATRLTQNQKFAEARKWFHYIFDPTLPSGDDNSAKRFWVTKPFRKEIETALVSIEDLLGREGNADELDIQLTNWEKNPFNPHAVARFRISAYMRNTVLRYIDNLIQWGDQLFRRDTIESINEATLLYVLASNILGPKQETVPARAKAVTKSFSDIKDSLDRFSNAKSEIETFISPSEGSDAILMPYFCLPPNDNLLGYWDTVADRLFKIRHCMNIDGVVRQLPLFEPPIDPALLVRAKAAGLDLNTLLNDIDASIPHYRFQVMLQHANSLCNDVKSLGNSLLSALEKKDAESLSLLRSTQELAMLELIRNVRMKQVVEAKENLNSLLASKAVVDERLAFYNKNVSTYVNPSEKSYFDLTKQAIDLQQILELKNYLSSILAFMPQFKFGSGFTIGSTFGGSNLADAEAFGTNAIQSIVSLNRLKAENASIKGNYDRRMDEWKYQSKSAELELRQLDKQLLVAEIRLSIVEKELDNHDVQMEQSKEVNDYMRGKFTSEELYDWMISQLSTVYFQSYQLAYAAAKKAEKCIQHELGLQNTNYIQFGYWDSLKKGLLCGDTLQYSLRKLETAYLEENEREYEIVKHISLLQLDPLALVKLRASSTCEFEVPEALYDMDHPGHYFRRIKSISITLPCIAGPYTSVSATLTLNANRYRWDKTDAGDYQETLLTDMRFVYKTAGTRPIATSNAQNDSGIFELNFRDERYLPFEGMGAISKWKLELPSTIRQFDYKTISDVIMHVKYTAREGGSNLKSRANEKLKELLSAVGQELNESGLHTLINLKYDRPNDWYLLKNNGQTSLTIEKSRLPYFVQSFDTAQIEKILLIAGMKDNPSSFVVVINGNITQLARVDELNLYKGEYIDIDLNTLFTLAVAPEDKAKLEELVMVIKYRF